MREPLGGTDHRQIWWLPTYLAELLERMAPILESWIQLKLKLTATSGVVGPIGLTLRGASGTTPYGEPIPTGPRGIEDPAEARRRANDAFSRFQRALEQGTPAVESFRSLILPALDLASRPAPTGSSGIGAACPRLHRTAHRRTQCPGGAQSGRRRD